MAKNIISSGQAAEPRQHVGLCKEEEDMICGTFPASAPSVNTTNSTSPIPSMNSTTGPKCECGFYCPASSSMSVVAFMKIGADNIFISFHSFLWMGKHFEHWVDTKESSGQKLR